MVPLVPLKWQLTSPKNKKSYSLILRKCRDPNCSHLNESSSQICSHCCLRKVAQQENGRPKNNTNHQIHYADDGLDSNFSDSNTSTFTAKNSFERSKRNAALANFQDSATSQPSAASTIHKIGDQTAGTKSASTKKKNQSGTEIVNILIPDNRNQYSIFNWIK